MRSRSAFVVPDVALRRAGIEARSIPGGFTDGGRFKGRWVWTAGDGCSATRYPVRSGPVLFVRAGRDAGRYIVVAIDGAFLDAQQAPWVILPEVDERFDTPSNSGQCNDSRSKSQKLGG